MKNFKLFKLLVLLGVLIMSINQLWAYSYTVYCVPKALYGNGWTEGSSKIKIWYKTNYSNTAYDKYMTKTEYKYNGNWIYSVTMDNLTGEGADWLYFQKFTSSNGWDDTGSGYKVFESWWGKDGFAGKIFAGEWSGSTPLWRNYAVDKTIYVYNAVSWGSLKIYTCDPERNGSWSGNTTGITSLGGGWYSVDIKGSATFILNNGSDGNDNKTSDISTSSVTDGRSYYLNKSTSPRGLSEKTLSVTFNLQGHGSAVSTQNVYYKAKATTPSPAPSATGYTFGGWYREAGCTNAWTFASDVVTKDTTLYAKWTANEYTTSNNIKESDGSTNAGTYKVTYDATSITYTTTPSKTGYNIAGLYKETTLTNKIVNDDRSLCASTSYTTSTSKWNQTSAPTLYVKWAAKTYSITLDKNNASASTDGSATATYDGELSSITAPTYSGYHVEGYYKEAGKTNKIAEGDGTLIASTEYTDGSGHWTKDGNVTLYAKWEVDATTYSLTFAAGSSPYNHGSVSGKVGGTTVSSGASHSEKSSVALTATADTHYRLKGWYSDAACSSAIDGAGTYNPYKFTLTGNTTVYAAFESSQTVITLNKNGGSTGAASVTATHGNALGDFTAHARAGYTLAGYYTTSSGGTKIINANGTLVASTDYTDASSKWNSDDRTLTLYAQWTEVKQTITTSVQYNAGTSSYTAVAANQVGIVTTSTLTASTPNSSHYTFAGWTLTNLEVTSGNASTDKVITVRVDDPSGDAPAAVANYNEVLTQSTWVLKGGMNITGDNWTTEHAMNKKSGESTSDVVYYTCNIKKTNSGSDSDNSFSFKIVKKGASDSWYGLGSGSGQYWYYHNTGELTMGTSSKDIQIIATSAGEYVIKVDYSTPASPKVTVEFPSQFIKGTWDSWTEHAFDKDGIYRVSLPASTTYEFCVNYKSTIYKKTTTISATTYDETLSTNGDNCTLKTGAAGYYTFGWNGTTKQLSVIFPGDTTKCKFTKDEYIYFDTRRLGSSAGWNKAAFSSRFWFKYYASGVDYDHIDCAIADTVEQGIYYAKVPAERLGQIQINRMATDFSSIYNTAAKVYALDRSVTTKNCLIEQTGHENDWNDWQPQWSSTTYCPPMQLVVLEDNGTTIAAGAGTKEDPYLIAASTTIKVTAASSTAYNDDAHMTHTYHFYDGATSKSSDQTGTTCEISASSSLNTVHKIVVKSFNTYNSQSSRVKKSDTIYYKTVAVYNVTYDANGANVGTAPSVATQYPSGYTHTVLGNSGSLAKEGYTFYAWNEEPDGSGVSHPIGGTVTFTSSDITLYAEWADDHIYYFSGATDDDWSKATNWTKGAVPNDIANTIYILNPVEIPASTTIKAAAVNIVTGGTYTRPYSQGTIEDCTGHLSIAAGGELVINGTLKKVEDASDLSTKVATEEADLHIGSDGTHGNGALIMGSHDGTNQATVDFYTKSHSDLAADQRAYAKNQFIGTPFNDCNDITYRYYNSWVYGVDYSGSTPTWKRINGGEGMNPFEGYCVISADAAGHVYQMEGTLVASSDQTIDLHYLGSSTDQKENLLANSWTAPIRIASFVTSDFTNADATIYIFNTGSPEDAKIAGSAAIDATSAGQWITIPINSESWSGTPTVQVIPSMQSFSIYSNNEDPSKTPKIKLDYDHLVLTPAKNGTAAIVPNRAPKADGTIDEEEMGDPEVLRLFVRGTSGFGDNVIMLAREDFTDGFDNGWDGRKVAGAEVAPQMYALTTDGNMAYNCVPDMEGTVLSFTKGTEDATYTFSFEYEGDDTWYLNDLKEQTSTLISELDTYTFTSMTGDNAARFVISHTPIAHTPTAIENGGAIDGANVRKLMIDGTLYIIRSGQMFTADGQVVK